MATPQYTGLWSHQSAPKTSAPATDQAPEGYSSPGVPGASAPGVPAGAGAYTASTTGGTANPYLPVADGTYNTGGSDVKPFQGFTPQPAQPYAPTDKVGGPERVTGGPAYLPTGGPTYTPAPEQPYVQNPVQVAGSTPSGAAPPPDLMQQLLQRFGNREVY